MTSHLPQQVTNTSDDWTISGIPANQHRLTLTRLDPGSLYEVEMAAYNCAGEGQTAMVTFRTGEGQSLPQLGVPMGLRKSSQAQVRPASPCPTTHHPSSACLLWFVCPG